MTEAVHAEVEAPRARHDRAQLQLSNVALCHRLRAMDAERRARTCGAARSLVRSLRSFTRSGRVPLAAALGDAPPQRWQQYREDGSRGYAGDRTGFFFYYHAHEAGRASSAEHGHFHLFARIAAAAPGAARYMHLLAIGVDARGLPRRLFTTNRWVTDEAWHPADEVIERVQRIAAASGRGARPLDAWLRAQLGIFEPQIAALLAHRDRRIARRRRPLRRVLEDRRIHVLSECSVSVARQFAVFDRCLPTDPYARRLT